MDIKVEGPRRQEEKPLVYLRPGRAGIGITSGALYIRTLDGAIRYSNDHIAKIASLRDEDIEFRSVVPVNSLTFTWE